jgi:hypothetical protein
MSFSLDTYNAVLPAAVDCAGADRWQEEELWSHLLQVLVVIYLQQIVTCYRWHPATSNYPLHVVTCYMYCSYQPQVVTCYR